MALSGQLDRPTFIRFWTSIDQCQFRLVCQLFKIQAHLKGAGLTLFRFAPFQRRPYREAPAARLGLLRLDSVCCGASVAIGT